MKKYFKFYTIALYSLWSVEMNSQINENKTGAWYMYFWNTTLNKSRFGFQGDLQYRNWNLVGDLEQLLLRGGATFQPKNTQVKFTLGYAHISTGVYGDNKNTTSENRIYQEALLPQIIGERFYLIHRFRFEQRFVHNQDFRTRWRYNFFANIPLNKKELNKGAFYLAFYNELFINGERNIGNNNTVELFDRNRFYTALGFGLSNNLRLQTGYMKQITDNWSKGQLQLSLHHNF